MPPPPPPIASPAPAPAPTDLTPPAPPTVQDTEETTPAPSQQSPALHPTYQERQIRGFGTIWGFLFDANMESVNSLFGTGIFVLKNKYAIFSTIVALPKMKMLLNLIGTDIMLCYLMLPKLWLSTRLVSEFDGHIESAKSLYLMGADDLNLEKVPNEAFVGVCIVPM
ncbi:unnamed protein product [Fraxinus pennsylvanica]|uniref:Uncharacterized protein n=1 Tax=Fraxinus pennsylvanica TaxID=56036 RepID=A0AAD1YVN2_9LAMI|nr:unnamed protein product [Fraxinus pennsylvanica]